VLISQILIFFFSSRRRHTRFSRDWSSDVCSSDLNTKRAAVRMLTSRIEREELSLTWATIRSASGAMPRYVPSGAPLPAAMDATRSEEHTSELQSRENLVCRLLLEKKKKTAQRQVT